MHEQLQTNLGTFSLKRYPDNRDKNLRAWDSADILLLEYIAQSGLLEKQPRILIVNDAFGALTVALSNYAPVHRSDSYLARRACEENLKLNDCCQTTYQTSLNEQATNFDLVLMRLPKSNTFLEDTLIRLSKCLSVGCQIIATGMVKHMSRSQTDLFERVIGSTQVSLAQKKARLLIATVSPPSSSHIKTWSWDVPEYGLKTVNYPNVFANKRLDIGARLMLSNMPTVRAKVIVDLGCGNGILGFRAKQINPQSKLFFIDESYMAVESAKAGWNANQLGQGATFLVNDALSNCEIKANQILCNPPFHAQQTLSDDVAWRMIKQAHQHLVSGGEFRLIGNQHLKYHKKLERVFQDVRIIARNPKFVILSAIRS